MTNWVRHVSIVLSDGIRNQMKTATAEQKLQLKAIDIQVVAISKQEHANDSVLNDVKVKLYSLCKANKLHHCEIGEYGVKSCIFEQALSQ